jgi:hypothetical protein
MIAVIPIALFCTGMTLIGIRFLFFEDIGPVEEITLPVVQKVIFWTSMISLPCVWVLGFTIAHRFNCGLLRLIPFIGNILPMSGLLWTALIFTRTEGREFVWIACYTGTLLALLSIGIVAALRSKNQQPQPPNKGRQATASPSPAT